MLFIATVAICLAAAQGTAGDIVIRDAEGRSNVEIEVGSSGELLVVGRYADLPGLPHAEFRIDGLPEDWIVSVTPHFLAHVVIGDPFLGGANIGFSACNPGQDGEIVLFTAVIRPATTDTAQLELQAHTTPSNPAYQCPLIVHCQASLGAICLEPGVRGSITGVHAAAIENQTWSRIKAIFRQ